MLSLEPCDRLSFRHHMLSHALASAYQLSLQLGLVTVPPGPLAAFEVSGRSLICFCSLLSVTAAILGVTLLPGLPPPRVQTSALLSPEPGHQTPWHCQGRAPLSVAYSSVPSHRTCRSACLLSLFSALASANSVFSLEAQLFSRPPSVCSASF